MDDQWMDLFLLLTFDQTYQLLFTNIICITTCPVDLLLNCTFLSFYINWASTSSSSSSPPSPWLLLPEGPGIPQTTLHKLSEMNRKFRQTCFEHTRRRFASRRSFTHGDRYLFFFILPFALNNPLRFRVLESIVDGRVLVFKKTTGTKRHKIK